MLDPEANASDSQDAIGILDPDLTVVGWNAAAERLYGIAASEAIGTNLRGLLAVEQPGQPDVVGDLLRPSLARTGFWNGRIVERVLRGPFAGVELIVDVAAILVHDPEAPAPRMLVTNRDVTANAHIEGELATLASLVTVTGRARSVEEVASAALDILCRATGADSGIVLSSDGSFDAIATRDANPATIGLILSFGAPGEAAESALAAPDAFIRADVDRVPLRPEVREALRRDGLRYFVGAGLHVPGRLVGVISLGWRQVPRNEPSKAVFLQAAALIAAAIENARLLALVESGLSEERLLTRRMRALVELTRLPTVVATDEGTDGADGRPLDGLLADINAVIGATGSVLGVVAGDRLRPVAIVNLDLERVAPLLDRPILDMPIVQPLLAGAASLLLPAGAASLSDAGQAEAEHQGFRTIAAFAIREDDRLTGIVFAVFTETVDELGLDERTLDAIGRVLDISFANRRLRTGVEASERRYRELFDGSPDAVIVESPDWLVVDANPAARRLYGDDLVGHSVEELIGLAGGESTVDDAGVTHFTGQGRRLDGSTFPQEVDLRSIQVAGETRTMAIVRDLTERSRLQAELVQAQKMEAVGLLVAGVAHELNNPLASIVAFSQLIRTDPALPADLRSQADLLVQEANRTRSIVGNLLDFARQRPPERVEQDLRPIVESVIGLQSYLIALSQLTVDVDIPGDLPPVSVDRSQFQQVLVNLTVNAAQSIRESGRPGRIAIRASVHDGWPAGDPTVHDGPGQTVRIEIADDGPGIPADIADRLFVPFVSSKPPGAGTGLGLSVSFGIVAAHGGTIHHEPNADGGATFVIELPVGGPRTETPEPPRDRLPVPTSEDIPAGTGGEPPATGHPHAAGARVLVLDDESSIRESLGRALARAGFIPVLAETGAQALEIVRADPPAAILCDQRMAGMSGTEFQAEVARIDPGLARRFAFMSGDVLNPELHEYATARGVRLLAKPFDITTVGEMVRSLLATPVG